MAGAAAAASTALQFVANAAGDDLVGVVVIENDLNGLPRIAWSYPDPGATLEASALSGTLLPVIQPLGCAVKRVENTWLYS